MTLVLMFIDAYQYNLYRRVQGRKARHLALLACVLCIIGERSPGGPVLVYEQQVTLLNAIYSLIFIVERDVYYLLAPL